MSHVRNRTKITSLGMSSNRVVFPSTSLSFHSSASFCCIALSTLNHFLGKQDLIQDRLPRFSHSDQLLTHVTWVQIDDLIMVNFDQKGSGRAVLTYHDANKCGRSFLYSNKPCTRSQDQCILSKSKWWTGSSSRRVKGIDRDDRYVCIVHGWYGRIRM